MDRQIFSYVSIFITYINFRNVLNVEPTTPSGPVFPMEYGYVSSALESTGGLEYISHLLGKSCNKKILENGVFSIKVIHRRRNFMFTKKNLLSICVT